MNNLIKYIYCLPLLLITSCASSFVIYPQNEISDIVKLQNVKFNHFINFSYDSEIPNTQEYKFEDGGPGGTQAYDINIQLNQMFRDNFSLLNNEMSTDPVEVVFKLVKFEVDKQYKGATVGGVLTGTSRINRMYSIKYDYQLSIKDKDGLTLVDKPLNYEFSQNFTGTHKSKDGTWMGEWAECINEANNNLILRINNNITSVLNTKS